MYLRKIVPQLPQFLSMLKSENPFKTYQSEIRFIVLACMEEIKLIIFK